MTDEEFLQKIDSVRADIAKVKARFSKLSQHGAYLEAMYDRGSITPEKFVKELRLLSSQLPGES